MPNSFATVETLQEGWRTLTPEETTRADALLTKASRVVRAEMPAVDDKITAGTIDADLVADVVCDMVRRVMVTPINQQAATQIQRTAGPYSYGVTFSNPNGDLYLTKTDRRKLGLLRQTASTISGILPRQPRYWDTPTGEA